VSFYFSQYIFDFSEQRASAKRLREREKILDCALIDQPLIFDKTPYYENWQPMLSGLQVIRRRAAWHAADVWTNDQQIRVYVVEAINGCAQVACL
jgi:hypothetical protein